MSSSAEHYFKETTAIEQVPEHTVPAVDVHQLCSCTHKDVPALVQEEESFEDECEDESKPQLDFICSICMDSVSEPVVTTCGHLSCWSCLHEWMKYKTACPVCSSGIEENGIIPIYVPGADSATNNPSFPARPQGQRCGPTKRFGISSYAEYSVSLPFLNFSFETDANWQIVAGTLLTVAGTMFMS